MKDLGARVAVAVVGIPAFLALAYLGGWALGVPLALVAALGAGEVYRFAECRGVRPMGWLGMAGAAAVVLAAVARPDFATLAPWALGVLGAVMFVGLLVALWARGPGGSPLAAVATTLFGVAYTGLPVAFILLLHALPARLARGDGKIEGERVKKTGAPLGGPGLWRSDPRFRGDRFPACAGTRLRRRRACRR